MVDSVVRNKLEEIAKLRIPEYLESEKLKQKVTQDLEAYLGRTITADQWDFMKKYPWATKTFKEIELSGWYCRKFEALCKKPLDNYLSNISDHAFSLLTLSKNYPNIFVDKDYNSYSSMIYIDDVIEENIEELNSGVIKDMIKMVDLRNEFRVKLDSFMSVVKDPGFTITKLKENFSELYNLYKNVK